MSDLSDFSSLNSECGSNIELNVELNKRLCLADDSSLDDFQFGFEQQEPEPTLKLSCNIRNLILSSLNRHTILMKKDVDNDEWFKNKIFDDNNRLVQFLLNLPLHKHGQKSIKRFRIEENENLADSEQQALSAFELAYSLRDRIVLNLFNNHNSIVLYNDATGLQKDQLVKENGELKQLLLNLPEIAEEVHEAVDGEIYKLKSLSFVPSEQEINLNDAKIKNMDEVDVKKKAITILPELDELRKQLMERIDNLDTNREKAAFELKVNNLFSLDLSKTHFSKDFYCRGSKWRLGIKSVISNDQKKYLSVYLHCADNFDLFYRFNVEAKFTLVSRRNKNRSLSYKHLFTKSSSNWGWEK